MGCTSSKDEEDEQVNAAASKAQPKKDSKKEPDQPAGGSKKEELVAEPKREDGKWLLPMVLVGDGAVGKTCLVGGIKEPPKEFSDDYEPTCIEAESLDWKAYPDLKIELWDTPGQEALGNLRALAYPNCKIFIIGYACDELKSLNNICPDGEDGKPKEKSWLKEINDHSPAGDVPWTILVGCKSDIRHADVTVEKAEEVAKLLNVCGMVDTSAKTNVGLDDFKTLVGKLATYKFEGHKRPNWGEFKWR